MLDRLAYIYLYPLFAACLLSACASDDPEGSKGSELSFDVSDLSRASVTTSFDEFAVYGDMKLTNTPIVVFDNTKVRWNNGWRYEGDTQYWFPQHEHSFIGVQPAIPDAEYSDSRLSFEYTVPDDYKSASDLLVATHRRMYYADSKAEDVTLTFQHIMSRIDFKAKNDAAADIVKVTNVTLEGVNKTGSFSIIPAPLQQGSLQTNDYVSSWTGISNKGDIVADIDVRIPEDKEMSLFPDDSDALFVIPQPENEDVTMHITYTLIDAGADPIEMTLTSETPIGGWKPGMIYTYSLSIEENSKEIYLTVSVKPWQAPKDPTVVPIPES